MSDLVDFDTTTWPAEQHAFAKAIADQIIKDAGSFGIGGAAIHAGAMLAAGRVFSRIETLEGALRTIKAIRRDTVRGWMNRMSDIEAQVDEAFEKIDHEADAALSQSSQVDGGVS